MHRTISVEEFVRTAYPTVEIEEEAQKESSVVPRPILFQDKGDDDSVNPIEYYDGLDKRHADICSTTKNITISDDMQTVTLDLNEESEPSQTFRYWDKEFTSLPRYSKYPR